MIGNRENDLELLIHSIRSAAAGTTYRFGASNIFSKLQVVAMLFIKYKVDHPLSIQNESPLLYRFKRIQGLQGQACAQAKQIMTECHYLIAGIHIEGSIVIGDYNTVMEQTIPLMGTTEDSLEYLLELNPDLTLGTDMGKTSFCELCCGDIILQERVFFSYVNYLHKIFYALFISPHSYILHRYSYILMPH